MSDEQRTSTRTRRVITRKKLGFVVVGIINGKPTLLDLLQMPQDRSWNGLLVPITNSQGKLFNTRQDAWKAIAKTRRSKQRIAPTPANFVVCPVLG